MASKVQEKIVWRRSKTTPRVQRIQTRRHDLTREELAKLFEAYILCGGDIEATALRLGWKTTRIYGIFDRIRDKRAALRSYENWILSWTRKDSKLRTMLTPRGTEEPYQEDWHID